MPTTNPRINVILEEPVYEGLRRWAKRGRRGSSACRPGERSRADARPEQGDDAFANVGLSQVIETLTRSTHDKPVMISAG
jgi:hypothetical protein